MSGDQAVPLPPDAVVPYDPMTEPEGFRAYNAGLKAGRAQGAAAERERILDGIDELSDTTAVVGHVSVTLLIRMIGDPS